MLHAITHRKAGRNVISDEINWQQLFKTSEDSLTSFVFERLFYLPTELFWSILTRACYGNELPNNPGKMMSKEFWPHWDAKQTTNTNFIEPDIFIRFSDFDLIVEAKRYDHNQQYRGQWINQIQAYRNEYSEEKKLYHLALGGLFSEETQVENGVHIVMCRWKSLLEQIQLSHRQLSESEGLLNSNDAILQVFTDLMVIFRLHGYATGLWFDSLPIHAYHIFTDGPTLGGVFLRRNRISVLNMLSSYAISGTTSTNIIQKWNL